MQPVPPWRAALAQTHLTHLPCARFTLLFSLCATLEYTGFVYFTQRQLRHAVSDHRLPLFRFPPPIFQNSAGLVSGRTLLPRFFPARLDHDVSSQLAPGSSTATPFLTTCWPLWRPLSVDQQYQASVSIRSSLFWDILQHYWFPSCFPSHPTKAAGHTLPPSVLCT